jgi:MFS family permease
LFIAVIPATISVLLVGLVREAPTSAATTTTRADHTIDATRRLPKQFWRAVVPLTVFACVNSTDTLLLQRSSELGLSVMAVVFAYVLYNVVYASLSYPAGKLADHVPARLVFVGGLAVFAVVYIGLGVTTSAAAVWMLLPLYGGYAALTDGVSRAWIANLVTTEQRTWALGLHGAASGVGVLLAGLWSGLAWQGNGRIPLTVSGIVAMIVAAWLLVSRDPSQRRAQ